MHAFRGKLSLRSQPGYAQKLHTSPYKIFWGRPKSTFLLLSPDCTCRIHQQKFALQVPVTPSFCSVCHRNASETTSSADKIRFKKLQFVEKSSDLIENLNQKRLYSASLQMLHSLAGLKTQKSRTKCSFVNTGVSRLTTMASD